MAQKTSIAWTDWTWSPVIGCSRTSPGCENCYAERLVGVRFSRNPKLPMYHGLASVNAAGDPRWSGEVRFLPERLAEPLSWKKPRKVFVCDMSDLFHRGVTNEQIAAVFGIMAATPHITYQILTKRAERLPEWFAWVESQPTGLATIPTSPKFICAAAAQKALGDGWHWTVSETRVWPLPNLWVGVTVEDQKRADERIPHLLRVPARVRFLSCEPLLEEIDLSAFLQVVRPIDDDPLASFLLQEAVRDGSGDGPRALDQVIIGGESGPKARPLDLAWVRKLVQQCRDAGVKPFVKQLGAKPVLDLRTTGNFRTHNGARQFEMTATSVPLRDRAGGDMDEWPEDLRIRQFPGVSP